MENDRNREDANRKKRNYVDETLHRYSEWYRRRVENLSSSSLKTLAIKSCFLTVAIIIDGVILPSIIILLNRTLLSFALFGILLFSALIAEAFTYQRLRIGARKAPSPSNT